MARYSWSYEPKDEAPKGQVFLTLVGHLRSSKEVLLPKADSTTGVETGVLRTSADLGDLMSGILRSDDKGLAISWFRVIDLQNGTIWKADGIECDDEGQCPLLAFEKAPNPQKKTAEEDDSTGDSEGDNEADSKSGESSSQDSSGSGQPASDEGSGSGDAGGNNTGTPPNGKGGLADLAERRENLTRGLEFRPRVLNVGGQRVFEIYGLHNNNLMPLNRILSQGPLNPQITKIFITTDGTKGYGLGGDASKWAQAAGVTEPNGQVKPPSKFGLDDQLGGVVASDGNQAWPVTSDFLAAVFGDGWAKVVYG